MAYLDLVFGSVLISTFVDVILLTAVFISTVAYYRDYARKDPLFIRICVGFSFLLALTSVMCICATFYFIGVTNWGNPAISNAWPRAARGATVATGLSCANLGAFLIFRLSKISPSKLFSIMFLPILSLSCLLAPVGTLILSALPNKLPLGHVTTIAMDIWLIGGASSDAALACCMLYCFFRLQRRYPDCTFNFKLFMIRALASGLVCSAWAIVTLIVWFTRHDSLPIALAAPLSSVYSLTLIANLGFRESDPVLSTAAEKKAQRDYQAAADSSMHQTKNIASFYSPWTRFNPPVDYSDTTSRAGSSSGADSLKDRTHVYSATATV